jgi:Protein of unknown function (DUF3768)
MNNDIRKARAAIIAELNDQFRRSGQGGKVVISHGVWERGPAFVWAAVAGVQFFEDFTAQNDPSGEHNAGSFEAAGKTVNWQIDYYDADGDFASNDPANPDMTTRVLTIFLKEEE